MLATRRCRYRCSSRNRGSCCLRFVGDKLGAAFEPIANVAACIGSAVLFFLASDPDAVDMPQLVDIATQSRRGVLQRGDTSRACGYELAHGPGIAAGQGYDARVLPIVHHERLADS